MITVYCFSFAPAMLYLKLGPGGQAVQYDNAAVLFFFTLIAQLSDILIFSGGLLFGQRVVAPAISPSKTWEGLASGTAAATLVGVLAVAGLFTGAVALYAALTESDAVRRQAAAAVWPYVQLLSWDSIAPGEEFFRISMTNSGVGPARIEAVRLKLEGATATTWMPCCAHS